MSRVQRKVTRDVDPADVADLVDDAPRAHLAVVEGARADVLPVATQRRGGRQLVGVPAGAPDLAGREVHLVRDDGAYWFELRALAVRGVLHRVEPGRVDGDADHDHDHGHRPGLDLDLDLDRSLDWYVLDPGRTVAWDYGALRAAQDA